MTWIAEYRAAPGTTLHDGRVIKDDRWRGIGKTKRESGVYTVPEEHEFPFQAQVTEIQFKIQNPGVATRIREI